MTTTTSLSSIAEDMLLIDGTRADKANYLYLVHGGSMLSPVTISQVTNDILTNKAIGKKILEVEDYKINEMKNKEKIREWVQGQATEFSQETQAMILKTQFNKVFGKNLEKVKEGYEHAVKRVLDELEKNPKSPTAFKKKVLPMKETKGLMLEGVMSEDKELLSPIVQNKELTDLLSNNEERSEMNTPENEEEVSEMERSSSADTITETSSHVMTNKPSDNLGLSGLSAIGAMKMIGLEKKERPSLKNESLIKNDEEEDPELEEMVNDMMMKKEILLKEEKRRLEEENEKLKQMLDESEEEEIPLKKVVSKIDKGKMKAKESSLVEYNEEEDDFLESLLKEKAVPKLDIKVHDLSETSSSKPVSSNLSSQSARLTTPMSGESSDDDKFFDSLIPKVKNTRFTKDPPFVPRGGFIRRASERGRAETTRANRMAFNEERRRINLKKRTLKLTRSGTDSDQDEEFENIMRKSIVEVSNPAKVESSDKIKILSVTLLVWVWWEAVNGFNNFFRMFEKLMEMVRNGKVTDEIPGAFIE